VIKKNDRKMTAKQFAVTYWLDHLYGTCAWGEDDSDFDELTDREYTQVRKHLEKLFRRMTRMLEKSNSHAEEP
jgi:hypothetical protein